MDIPGFTLLLQDFCAYCPDFEPEIRSNGMPFVINWIAKGVFYRKQKVVKNPRHVPSAECSIFMEKNWNNCRKSRINR